MKNLNETKWILRQVKAGEWENVCDYVWTSGLSQTSQKFFLDGLTAVGTGLCCDSPEYIFPPNTKNAKNHIESCFKILIKEYYGKTLPEILAYMVKQENIVPWLIEEAAKKPILTEELELTAMQTIINDCYSHGRRISSLPFNCYADSLKDTKGHDGLYPQTQQFLCQTYNQEQQLDRTQRNDSVYDFCCEVLNNFLEKHYAVPEAYMIWFKEKKPLTELHCKKLPQEVEGSLVDYYPWDDIASYFQRCQNMDFYKETLVLFLKFFFRSPRVYGCFYSSVEEIINKMLPLLNVEQEAELAAEIPEVLLLKMKQDDGRLLGNLRFVFSQDEDYQKSFWGFIKQNLQKLEPSALHELFTQCSDENILKYLDIFIAAAGEEVKSVDWWKKTEKSFLERTDCPQSYELYIDIFGSCGFYKTFLNKEKTDNRITKSGWWNRIVHWFGF